MQKNNKCKFCNKGKLIPYFKLNKNSLETIRCNNCKIVIVKNTPIKSDNISEYYSMDAFKGKRDLQDTDKYIKYYTNCYKDYNENDLTIKQFKTILFEIKKKLSDLKEIKLLDIGCATGIFLDLAKKMEYSVYGVEISKELSKYAREHFDLKIENDLLEASYPSNYFDVITLLDVVEHLPVNDFFIIFKEIQRILKPSGILIIRTPSEDALLRNIAKVIYFCSFKKLENLMHLFYSYEHILNFLPNTLSNVLKKYGFRIILQRREEENPNRLNINFISKLILKFLYLISLFFNKKHKMIQFYMK